jgi:hypothetical protein
MAMKIFAKIDGMPGSATESGRQSNSVLGHHLVATEVLTAHLARQGFSTQGATEVLEGVEVNAVSDRVILARRLEAVVKDLGGDRGRLGLSGLALQQIASQRALSSAADRSVLAVWLTIGFFESVGHSSENWEVYDYPGEYAQRFDGVDKGGG